MVIETGRCVRVRAPARLHLGFFDLNGGLGRRFGSLGLAIDQPAVELELGSGEGMTVSGPEEGRARRYLQSALAALDIAPRHHLVIREVIPAHQGYGSGTQLALAIVAALACHEGTSVPIADIAAEFERGARSGIGIGAFDSGGFVIDGGRGARTVVPPVTSRMPFPETWRLVLVEAPDEVGIHGAAEAEAFRTLPPMGEAECGVLCRLVLMQLLPGLAEGNVGAVGTALTEIQARVGDYFAPAQPGGRFASGAVAEALHALDRLGAEGFGQTSWGPTGFALFATEDAAQMAVHHIRSTRSALSFRIVRGRNVGARVGWID